MKSLLSALTLILLLTAGAVAQDTKPADKQPVSDQPKYITYSVVEKAQANIVAKAAKKRVAHAEKLIREAYKLQARLEAIQAELSKPENRIVAEVVKVAPEK